MTKSIHISDDGLYLSKRYLKQYASVKTIEDWYKYTEVIKVEIDNDIFYLYKSIPYRTRKKLPPADRIISLENKKSILQELTELIHDAFYVQYNKFKPYYQQESKFSANKVTRFAKVHAVFEAILDRRKKTGSRDLQVEYSVFNDFFPRKYKSTNALSNAIRKASTEGIISVAIDKRAYGNNDRGKKEDSPQIDFIMSLLVSCNGKYSRPQMLEKLNTYSRENNLKELSLSWVKKQAAFWLKNPEIYKSRYGQTEAQKKLPYASLKGANYTHVQWQVDGVVVPFWALDFLRLVLVFVLDNCSKKIIGYSIGDTENSEVIKDAIRKAVYNCNGIIPNELVMDNHSFTQTKSAFNLENLFSKLGARITKTSNPRQKVYIERYIQYLNAGFKKYHGYLGQSIRSKSIEAIASNELRAEYAKNFKSKNEIIAIITAVIDEYNKTPQKGISPNDKYEQNPHDCPITLNKLLQGELLPYQKEKKIDRGQITIMNGVEKFEYQLPAHLFQIWNDKTVLVSYDNLYDGIYMYNTLNGEGIAYLPLKDKINNSLAAQTIDDEKALHRNKGRLNGINVQARKQLEDVRNRALNIDPEAYAKVNPLLTPKNVIKQLEQDANLRLLVEDNGVNSREIYAPENAFDVAPALRPAEKDKNPFTVTNNKIELIDPSKDLLENDD